MMREVASRVASSLTGGEFSSSVLQILIPFAFSMLTNREPSGLNSVTHSSFNGVACPKGRPSAAFQNLADLSLVSVRMREPSGLNSA